MNLQYLPLSSEEPIVGAFCETCQKQTKWKFQEPPIAVPATTTVTLNMECCQCGSTVATTWKPALELQVDKPTGEWLTKE